MLEKGFKLESTTSKTVAEIKFAVFLVQQIYKSNYTLENVDHDLNSILLSGSEPAFRIEICIHVTRLQLSEAKTRITMEITSPTSISTTESEQTVAFSLLNKLANRLATALNGTIYEKAREESEGNKKKDESA